MNKINTPKDALEELARFGAVMIDHPGERKLNALKYAVKAVKRMVAMPLQNKEIGFGDQALVCPNCGQGAVVNPFRKGREIYPYCPWCGQKLKEAEDEQTE